jgi:hypothetical protein
LHALAALQAHSQYRNRPEQHRLWWAKRHDAMACQFPGLKGYVQNHVIDSEERGIFFKHGPELLEGCSQQWFNGALR